MVFNQFLRQLILRIAVLTLVLYCLVHAVYIGTYIILTMCLGALTLLLIYQIYMFLSKTHRELSTLINAIKFNDFSIQFLPSSEGAGYEKLSQEFNTLIKSFKESRQEQEEHLRYLKALTEHVPVPLLSLYPNGKIHLQNNAARRLFGTLSIRKLDDLKPFNASFPNILKQLKPGQKQLIQFSYKGIERQLTTLITEISIGKINQRLISLQDIQSELDDIQLRSWQDLVRVLTHEMMNSINPISSLSKTTSDLLQELSKKYADSVQIQEDLTDIQQAVKTVSKRSDGLMQFVESYRSLTHIPSPQKKQFSISDMFKRLTDLHHEKWKQKGIRFTQEIKPENLQLIADPDLIEQLLINLLRNAEHAVETLPNPQLSLNAFHHPLGYAVITVFNNGPSIPTHLLEEIFVPFFTTRKSGSGVGLALARQIMIAHKGSITVSNIPEGGVMFTLLF